MDTAIVPKVDLEENNEPPKVEEEAPQVELPVLKPQRKSVSNRYIDDSTVIQL